MSTLFKRKKQKADLDINQSILVDIILKRFDELEENLKTLIIDKMLDHERRLSELEGLESKITVLGSR